jgi:hypothetical protein
MLTSGARRNGRRAETHLEAAGKHLQLRPASRARLPLRLAPDVSVRVATETVGGRKVEQNLHRFRTPCCTPTVRLNLDLALPD